MTSPRLARIAPYMPRMHFLVAKGSTRSLKAGHVYEIESIGTDGLVSLKNIPDVLFDPQSFDLGLGITLQLFMAEALYSVASFMATQLRVAPADWIAVDLAMAYEEARMPRVRPQKGQIV